MINLEEIKKTIEDLIKKSFEKSGRDFIFFKDSRTMLLGLKKEWGQERVMIRTRNNFTNTTCGTYTTITIDELLKVLDIESVNVLVRSIMKYLEE